MGAIVFLASDASRPGDRHLPRHRRRLDGGLENGRTPRAGFEPLVAAGRSFVATRDLRQSIGGVVNQSAIC